MKNEQIHRLIEKYFDGNTSLEEERILDNYFSDKHTIDNEFRLLKRQFEIMRKGREISSDSFSLESGILSRIDSYEKEQQPQVKRLSLPRMLIAAAVIMFISITAVLVFRAQHNRLEDTFSDPHLAYLETQKTLLLISQKMNKGMEPLSNISRMNTGTEQLKNLQKIDESMGMLNLVSFINQSSNMKK